MAETKARRPAKAAKAAKASKRAPASAKTPLPGAPKRKAAPSAEVEPIPAREAAAEPVRPPSDLGAPREGPEAAVVAAPAPTWQRPAAQQPPAFDPATGAWIPMPDSPPVGQPRAWPDAPDARRPPGPVYVMWSILLWIDLALIALSTLFAVFVGLVLFFAPESDQAQTYRDMLTGGDQADLVANTVLTFVAFGVIPFLWVVGTRLHPVEGTKAFLRLHEPGKGIVRGIALAVPMLIAVVALITLYTVITEGPDALTNPDPGEEANPAVQAILDNLSWPIAVLVAVCAGVGEEIFFRGLLQRYIGVWGQGILFGLAHSTGGYLPQVVFAFALGIVFGFLIKRGWSLWSLIVAHVLYDFTLLALALVAPEFG